VKKAMESLLSVDGLRDNYRDNRILLVDVGASGGLAKRWKRVAGDVEVLAFDADTRACGGDARSGSGNGVTIINRALYDSEREVDVFLTRKQMVSSIYEPNYPLIRKFKKPERFEVVEKKKIYTSTLDKELKSRHIDSVDFIKLDTQGSELAILHGGKSILPTVFGIEVEVETVEIYKSQPLFPEVDLFLRQYGFDLFDFRPTYWKREKGRSYGGAKGQLVSGDALYFAKIEKVNDLLANKGSGNEKKKLLLKYMAICTIYGYMDYALELYEEWQELFDPDEARAFRQYLDRSVTVSRRMPSFPGRDRIARWLLRMYNVLKGPDRIGRSVKQVLGNTE